MSGVSNRHILRGSSNTYIHFNEHLKSWKISLYSTNTTFALLDGEENIYPFGKHFWRITNDTCKYNDKTKLQSQLKELSFDSCNRDEFNCQDGSW